LWTGWLHSSPQVRSGRPPHHIDANTRTGLDLIQAGDSRGVNNEASATPIPWLAGPLPLPAVATLQPHLEWDRVEHRFIQTHRETRRCGLGGNAQRIWIKQRNEATPCIWPRKLVVCMGNEANKGEWLGRC
jgi:hypothetical protein